MRTVVSEFHRPNQADACDRFEAGKRCCTRSDVRGERVLLDADLATLYGVATGALNQAVKRNLERFPADFMFQLSIEEWEGSKDDCDLKACAQACDHNL